MKIECTQEMVLQSPPWGLCTLNLRNTCKRLRLTSWSHCSGPSSEGRRETVVGSKDRGVNFRSQEHLGTLMECNKLMAWWSSEFVGEDGTADSINLWQWGYLGFRSKGGALVSWGGYDKIPFSGKHTQWKCILTSHKGVYWQIFFFSWGFSPGFVDVYLLLVFSYGHSSAVCCLCDTFLSGY